VAEVETGVTIKRVVCPHDCPDACMMLAHVRDGRLIRVTGDPDHPFTQGFLCAKTNNYEQRVYSPDRIMTPLRRVGAKGEGRFEPITWDEALAAIAGAFERAAAEYGPESILPYSYCGTMGVLQYQSMDRRFFARLGASKLERTICSTAGKEGWAASNGPGANGNPMGADPEAFGLANLIVLWGTNTLSTNVHLVPQIKAAMRRGAHVVCIDPHRHRTAELAHEFLQIRPGTDAALALGMMRVIVDEGLEDRDYVERYTLGFDRLEERLREYPVERVAEITDLPGEAIVGLARRWATTRPAVIRVNYGLQRHTNGGMAVRTISLLPALTGAWRDAGGGANLSTGGAFALNLAALHREDLTVGKPRSISMNQLGEALLSADPPVKALYVYSSNPAAVAPDGSKVRRGLLREDLFVAVHEQVMTDTCAYADVVIPATTCFEHEDLYTAYGHLYLQYSEAAIAPVGESKRDTEVFRLLAERLGFEEPELGDDDETLMRRALVSEHPHMAGITLDRLKERRYIRLEVGGRYHLPYANGGFTTPSGRAEFYAERLIDQGLDPLPIYTPIAESRDGSPELHRRYPLNLITPAAHHFLNSSFANQAAQRRREARPTLEIAAADAEARGIGEGERVRIFNERGWFEAWASIGEAVPKGTVCSTSVWWNRHSPGGRNCNWTTSDRLTDMGRGATFHTNLVQVERLDKDFSEPAPGALAR
jgi:anaerobic selenocysteine-containing dehydrogenase